MNNNKKDLLHQSFTGIKKYGKEFIEYTKEVEADADCISKKYKYNVRLNRRRNDRREIKK